MGSGRLEITDTVFAAYLISKGCELIEIEPAQVNGRRSISRPKMYIFSEDVKDTNLEDYFWGYNALPAYESWRGFITAMDRVIEIEDVSLRQETSRPSETGIRVIKKETYWITTNQAVAAFLLSPWEEQLLHPAEVGAKHLPMPILVDVIPMGIDKGARFLFNQPKRSHDLWMSMMKDNPPALAPWWFMKSCHKRATALRRIAMRHHEKRKEAAA